MNEVAPLGTGEHRIAVGEVQLELTELYRRPF
jgi:hypothetical protein